MTVFYPLIVGLLPSLVWTLFYLHEDEDHPEPRKILFYAFLAGGASTFFVFGPQMWLSQYLPTLGIAQFSFASLFMLAGLEELFKFLAVYIVISKRKEFDTPIHAMVFMVIASLGFAAVENIAAIVTHGNTLQPWFLGSQALEVTSLRFVGATLLHTISSAFVGYYWALAMIERRNFVPLIAEGIGIGTLIHAIFNGLIVSFGPTTILATLLLVTMSFFVLNDFEELKQVS